MTVDGQKLSQFGSATTTFPSSSKFVGVQTGQDDLLYTTTQVWDAFAGFPFLSVTIEPAANTLDTGLVINFVTASGSVPAPIPPFNSPYLNLINITDRTNINSPTVPTINGLEYRYNYQGGPDAGGAHQAFSIEATFDGLGATPVTDTGHPALQAMSAFVSANQSWGGSSGTPKGDLFVGQFQTTATDAVGLDHCETYEFDNVMNGTSTARIRTIFSLLRGGDTGIFGSLIDACINIGTSDGTNGGWGAGIQFYNSFGNPINSSAGTLINAKTEAGAAQTFAALNGLDFSAVTFSGSFLKGAGWSVDASGNMHLNMTNLVNAVNDAAAAIAGASVGQVYRNGSILMVRVA